MLFMVLICDKDKLKLSMLRFGMEAENTLYCIWIQKLGRLGYCVNILLRHM